MVRYHVGILVKKDSQLRDGTVSNFQKLTFSLNLTRSFPRQQLRFYRTNYDVRVGMLDLDFDGRKLASENLETKIRG